MDFENPNLSLIKNIRYVSMSVLSYIYVGVEDGYPRIVRIPFEMFGVTPESLQENLKNPNRELLLFLNNLDNWH